MKRAPAKPDLDHGVTPRAEGPGFVFQSRGDVIVDPLVNDPYLPSHLRTAGAIEERKRLNDIVLGQLQRTQDEEIDRILRGDTPILNKFLVNSPKRNRLPWHKRKWYEFRRRWANAVEAWREG